MAAARSRFVPIAMTSLATVIGLIPTAMGLERGSEANQPLALAVVGGLTSSTILSLFLVPVMFLFFAKKRVADDEHAPRQAGRGARMIARVLVALDDSARAEGVFDAASEIAQRFAARLHPLRVVSVPPEFPAAAAGSLADPLSTYLVAHGGRGAPGARGAESRVGPPRRQSCGPVSPGASSSTLQTNSTPISSSSAVTATGASIASSVQPQPSRQHGATQCAGRAHSPRGAARNGEGRPVTRGPGRPVADLASRVRAAFTTPTLPLVDLLVATLGIREHRDRLRSLAGAASGVALAHGDFGWATLGLLVACVGDGLDGPVARRTRTASTAGALFDASADRYQEAFALGGLAVYFRESASMLELTLFALVGSFMVSYGSAKAEAAGVPVPASMMRRPERAAVLWVGVASRPPSGQERPVTDSEPGRNIAL